MIDLTLPWPPSTNSVWRSTGKRTYLTHQGRKFRKDVAGAIAEQWGEDPLAGRLAVKVTLMAPDKRKRDIDNHGGKALLDAITCAGVWVDDEQIDRLTIVRGDNTKGGQCRVEIREVE